ncbi:Uncharacterised protein [Bordetella pertussis]|nr:Uncharacterised protein [Bordetella pertussis]CFO74459.1 Uncharacterised protein [Bordetella pertussis]CFP66819.1 Uncharacterised protein [Bordetella pertussis]CFU84437.1 Uncharacterised protein [Bordetella pertussis]CFW43886.1 Uncharacterised protein [Bordetella pertussis]
MCRPVAILNSSPVRWVVEPTPEEAKNTVLGFSLAQATNSFVVWAGTVLLTTIRLGRVAIREIGWKSLFGSNAMSL